MGFLARRKPDNTPVRRVGEVVDIPSAPPPGAPISPQTQNPNGNTYVFVTAPQSPQPAATPQQQFTPPPQQTIHHHTTIIQQPRASRRGRDNHTSSLTVTAMSLALLACLTCWIPDSIRYVSIPLGGLGIIVGVLALLGAILFQRTSAGTPFKAIVLCLIAMGVCLNHNFLAKGVNALVGKTDLSTPSPQPTPASPTQNNSPSNPSPILPSSNAPPNPAPSAPPTAPPDVLTAARANLAAAQSKLATDLLNDPGYQAAKIKADAALDNLNTLRVTESAGSPDLVQASQQRIDADSALAQARKQAQLSNPTIAADAQAVQQAQANVTALENPKPPANHQ